MAAGPACFCFIWNAHILLLMDEGKNTDVPHQTVTSAFKKPPYIYKRESWQKKDCVRLQLILHLHTNKHASMYTVMINNANRTSTSRRDDQSTDQIPNKQT